MQIIKAFPHLTALKSAVLTDKVKIMRRRVHLLKCEVKGNAIPLQAWTGREGSRRLRLAEFLDSRHMNMVRLAAVRTGRLYPQEIFLVLISARG
jgi:hypothetical protein